MKLIGVTGKTGAGKTTLSNMLAENQNIGVIHVDDILRKIKLKYFKFLMSKNKDGEKTKINSRMKKILYGNKVLFNLFMKFRARLIQKPLEERINSLQALGKEYALIDDIFIKHLNVYKDLSKIFLVERPYAERKEAAMQRDNLTKEEMVAADTAHFKGNYKEISERINVIKINNNGSQDELWQLAKQIYIEHFANFKDIYKEKVRRKEISKNEEKNKETEIKMSKQERD